MERRGARYAMALGGVAPKLMELSHHVVVSKPSSQQQGPVVGLVLNNKQTNNNNKVNIHINAYYKIGCL